MNTLVQQFIKQFKLLIAMSRTAINAARDRKIEVAQYAVPFEFAVYPYETHHLFALQQQPLSEHKEDF